MYYGNPIGPAGKNGFNVGHRRAKRPLQSEKRSGSAMFPGLEKPFSCLLHQKAQKWKYWGTYFRPIYRMRSFFVYPLRGGGNGAGNYPGRQCFNLGGGERLRNSIEMAFHFVERIQK